jgi:hypothetical protein
MMATDEKKCCFLRNYFNIYLDVKYRNDLNDKAFHLKEFNLASMAVLTELF